MNCPGWNLRCLRCLAPEAIVGLLVLVLIVVVLVTAQLGGCAPPHGGWDGGPFAPLDSTITDRDSPI